MSGLPNQATAGRLYDVSMALVGDRERERAAAMLKEHYLRGRLSVEELGDRLGLALAARRDGDVRRALAGLPPAWREAAAAAWLRRDALAGRAKRAAVVAAVWLAWWTVSVVLLVGFVATVVLDGLTWANGILFPALWCACTLLARRVTRPRR
jgi:hypothetical protein